MTDLTEQPRDIVFSEDENARVTLAGHSGPRLATMDDILSVRAELREARMDFAGNVAATRVMKRVVGMMFWVVIIMLLLMLWPHR